MKKILLTVIALTALTVSACASKEKDAAPTQNQVIHLYDGPAPGSEHPKYKEDAIGDGDAKTLINVSDPTLTVYLPDKPNGTAMVVCPGGAFIGLAMENEGVRVAKWLNEKGITAFLLKYRLSPLAKADGTAPTNMMEMGLTMLKVLQDAGDRYSKKHNGAKPNVNQVCRELPNMEYSYSDADRAMVIVRKNAKKWNINSDKIGIMGFSAGGIITVHQAMVHSEESKPNFSAAIYGGWTNDVKAPSDAAPLWMCSPVNDLFSPEESYDCYRAWRDAKVPVELHTFWDCKHGFGSQHTGKNVDNWFPLMIQFMHDVKFLPEQTK